MAEKWFEVQEDAEQPGGTLVAWKEREARRASSSLEATDRRRGVWQWVERQTVKRAASF